MKIITIDGKEFDVKIQTGKESIIVDYGTVGFDYPDFVGTKLYQRSTSSDKYSLTFAIHKTLVVGLKESLKKFVTNESDAVNHPTYGKLLNIVLVHPTWGAIKGKILGSVKYNTGSEGDILCQCLFVEHTEDNPIDKLDIEAENLEAFNELDNLTNIDVEFNPTDKSIIERLTDNLISLYDNIQSSAVLSAINDLKREVNKATLDSYKLMAATKNLLFLPNELLSFDINRKLQLLKSQAEIIIQTPINSFNLAEYNTKLLAYNTGASTRTTFISESALQASAGIKSVPL